MKTARYSDAQIMGILKQAEGGVPVSELRRGHGMSSDKNPIFKGEEILGLTPEEGAADLGWRAGEKAKELTVGGIILQELLEWKINCQKRQAEFLQDRLDRRLTSGPETK